VHGRDRIISPIQEILNELHADLTHRRMGQVASYIPELAKADPEWFGICLVTADGTVYQVGDTDQSFTIQSISKAIVYGIALEDNGVPDVCNKVWLEPSGEAFNAISLDPETGQPANPMINAGAIATTSLVAGTTTQQKLHRILDTLNRYAGRKLAVDQAVYRSESEHGHRNRAIAYLLRNSNIIEDDPLPTVEAYFMQCAISITCRDLGIMAATLANGGINPLTGERAVPAEYVENILSVMGSCGMYDAAGEWIYSVGMPAKSGVAGGIMAVLPGQLGIAVFSPRLDDRGNSVRGIAVCRELSRRFALHLFHAPKLATSVVRRMVSLSEISSRRLRSQREREAIVQAGRRVRIMELQGMLVFSTAEVAVRTLFETLDGLEEVILDFQHVHTVDFAAGSVLSHAVQSCLQAGIRVVVTRADHLPVLTRKFRQDTRGSSCVVDFQTDLDLVLEAAESRLLEAAGLRKSSQMEVSLAECELTQGLTQEELALLDDRLTTMEVPRNGFIVRMTTPGSELYLLMKGKASSWVPGSARNHWQRLSTLTPGMAFGEKVLLDDGLRAADIQADTDVKLRVLEKRDFDTLCEAHPGIMKVLYRNLALLATNRLQVAIRELSQHLQ